MSTTATHCSVCRSPLPGGVREEFCPVCSLRGALELEPDEPTLPASVRYVGDYELVEQIARGGMGVVYRARQKSLGRDVAVKMILAGHFASPEARARFRAEASAAAKLQHPNIVAIHEIGEHEGQPYFSMDFVEGRTLAELVRDGPLPAPRAATYLRAIAQGIHFAHTRGTLHRDLKPSNILIDPFDEPRVTDFGLARQLGDESELTPSGQMLGSPGYVSPEQARGERDAVTAASDVYSLGAILYHTLTGRAPFQGETMQAVLRQVESDEPVPPRRLNASVPEDLETIALKCLEKDPARRYALAKELADDLDRFLKGEPVHARPVSPLGRSWRWAKRRPALASALALVTLLLVTVAVVSTISAVRIRRAEQQATTNLRETLLSQAHALRVSGRDGQRPAILKAVRQAIALDLTRDQHLIARNEWIGAHALADVRFVPQQQLPPPIAADLAAFDARFERYARIIAGPVAVLHELSSGRELRRFDLGKELEPVRLGFSPGGGYLILTRGVSTTTVQLWEISSGRKVFDQVCNGEGLQVLPADTGFVVATRDGELVRHELPSGKELRRWPLKPAPGRTNVSPNVSLALTADGGRLAAAQWSGRPTPLDIFDADSGDLRKRLSASGEVRDLTWAADGATLTAGSRAGEVEVWLMPSGFRTYQFSADGAYVDSMAADVTGRLLAAASRDRRVRFYTAISGRTLGSLTGDSVGIAFAPDGRRVGPVSRDRAVGWIEYSPPEHFTEQLNGSTWSHVRRLSLAPDGRRFATLAPDAARVHSLTARSSVEVRNTSDLLYHPGDGSLISAGTGGVLRREVAEVRDTFSLGKSSVLLPPASQWTAIALSRDGATLAAGSRTMSAALVGPLTNLMAAVAIGPHPNLDRIALSPDARWLASTGLDRRLRIWEVANRRLAREAVVGVEVNCTFSPDGQWLAASGERFHLWKLESGGWQPGPTLPPPNDRALVDAAEFSPDGRMLALVLDLHAVHLLEFPSLKPLAMLDAPYRVRLRALAFSRDAGRLVAGGESGQIHIWELAALRAGLGALGLDW